MTAGRTPGRGKGSRGKRARKGAAGAPVDLARERRIRDTLGELAALVTSGEVDLDRTRAYLAGKLEAAPMEDAEDTPLSMRLPRAMVARLDALAARMGADPALAAMLGGGKPSRSAVLRLALARGLDALEASAAPAPAVGAAELLAELDALRVKVAALVAPTPAPPSEGTPPAPAAPPVRPFPDDFPGQA